MTFHRLNDVKEQIYLTGYFVHDPDHEYVRDALLEEGYRIHYIHETGVVLIGPPTIPTELVYKRFLTDNTNQ